jgi:hypothetical protein
MNTFMKTVRVVTDLVILAVMGLELKDQINKMRLEKAQRTVAAARAATQQENNNE